MMKKSKLLLMSLLLVGCSSVVKPVETTTTTTASTTSETTVSTIKDTTQAKKTGTAIYKYSSVDNVIYKIDYKNDVIKSMTIIRNQPIPENISNEKYEKMMLDSFKEIDIPGAMFDASVIDDKLAVTMTLNLNEVHLRIFVSVFGDKNKHEMTKLADILQKYPKIDSADKELQEQEFIKID